jgi:anti-sigma factor RsiW
MRLARLGAQHDWSQQHLSHYVEGDLSWLARRRIELHIEECPDCSRGIRAIRSLIRLMQATATGPRERAAAGFFDRVWLDAARAVGDSDSASG